MDELIPYRYDICTVYYTGKTSRRKIRRDVLATTASFALFFAVMMFTLKAPSIIFLAVLVHVVSCIDASNRPPFLAHVSKSAVVDAVAFAKTKHDEAVRKALENYPVDDIIVASIEDGEENKNVKLDRFEVTTQTSLPDFSDELGKSVFVTRPVPILTPAECDEVIQYAETYFQEQNGGEWAIQKSGQYDVAGFYIHQIPAVKEWFLQKVKSKLFPMLQRAFPNFIESPDELCVDNSYLFKYTPETGRRTDIHTDSGCLSFTIALNDKSEYEGGGTWFEGYGVLEMEKGQVTLRPGGLKHCGYAVTGGTRYIMGGFCIHRRKPEPVRMLLTHGLHSTELLEAAMVLNPNVDSAYNILASKYETQGDKGKAQRVLEYCLETVNPNSVESGYSLGTLYLSEGRAQEAMECMLRCLDTDPFDIDAMLGVAQCANVLGDSQVERKYCQNIIDSPGANKKVLASAYCNLGVLHAGEDVEIDYYKSSIENYPENFAASYSLASALASRGEWEEAIDIYKQSLSKEDDQEKRKRALTSMYRCVGHLLQARGNIPPDRQALVRCFQDTMGISYYNEMATLQQGTK